MKVIICGAGQVGFNIARYLSSEGADITLIDQSEALVTKIADSLDVQGMVGFASHPDILERAGAPDADMVIAVTYADEVNMVACQICHSLFDVTTKIARVRHQSYLNPLWSDLFSRDHLPIDVIISPEIEVARAVSRRLEVPGAFDVIPLADGKVSLIGVHCTSETPILDTPLRQLTGLFPDLHILVIGLQRDGRAVVVTPEDVMLDGDDVYFVAETAHLTRAMVAFGHEEKEARRVIIVGGGNIGLSLAEIVEEKYPHVALKLIEINKERAEYVAQQLKRTVVIHGDALDQEILEEANVKATETVIAVSNDDEVNILTSLLAKRFGTQRAVTLVNSTTYSPLIGTLGIDTVVSPREITVSTILQHVRQGRIRSVHSLSEGFGEIIEAEALETSSLVGVPLREADLPEGVLVGAIVRGDEVIIPRGDTVIKPKDQVVIFAAASAVKSVEKLFAVRLEFF
ncbi:MAG: Trk system potassium transporter TrkA [Kiloniellales bacterium]|nr:Trk system potassium transporter TrkA [Kiloniellales bacterium]MDJ0970031.1 Trk system potassium transporter TrkA [Kiloniellales bacterium]MDJ0980573.1 Trk system potassium transporter TrkA [Kiloniellales bacterium]